jgi:hypothetical protein
MPPRCGACDHRHQHQRPQGERIAQRQPGRRPPGPQPARGPQRAFDMNLPQRQGHRIAGTHRQIVGDRGCWAMAQAADLIEPSQRVMPGRQLQAHERERRRDRDHEEDEQADRPAEWRQCHPGTEPGDRQEQANCGDDGGKRRPDPLPQQRPADAPESLVER